VAGFGAGSAAGLGELSVAAGFALSVEGLESAVPEAAESDELDLPE